jgi:hypothetical protein
MDRFDAPMKCVKSVSDFRPVLIILMIQPGGYELKIEGKIQGFV